jgi:hypothetical protein
MITEEYFQQEYDRLGTLYRSSTNECSYRKDEQLFLSFKPEVGKESIFAELELQISVIQIAGAIAVHGYEEVVANLRHVADTDPKMSALVRKELFVIESSIGIEWK